MSNLEDEAAIRRLITIYSQLLDDGRYDEWTDLFTKDATFSVWDRTFVGRDGVREGIEGLRPPYPGKHVAFATIVEIAGDTALAWTDFVSLADTGPGEWGRSYGIATAARYYDEVVREGGRWRFAARRIRMAGDPLPAGAVETPPS
jgi:hypothetical protein